MLANIFEIVVNRPPRPWHGVESLREREKKREKRKKEERQGSRIHG